MKFFETCIKSATVYGHIKNGHFSISVWDFNADDYTLFEGQRINTRTAWKFIHHYVREWLYNNRYEALFEEPPFDLSMMNDELEEPKMFLDDYYEIE